MDNGILVTWDTPETKAIIRWDFYGVWSWADVYAAAKTSLNLRAEVCDVAHVPVIFNFQHHLHSPITGLLPNIRNIGELLDPRDVVVVTYASGYIRLIIDIHLGMNPYNTILVVPTLDDARDLIAAEYEIGISPVAQSR